MQSIAEESGPVEDKSPDERKSEQDEFLTGKNRLPFLEDSDDEIKKEDVSDNEEEE